MANKRKTTTAIAAGVTALALLLGGTFAWTSISQMAKNEAAGVVNVGGRLHDDFDGTNKDVYVENFTDPLNGGQPIYARVKLTEYMEVGQDAGGRGDADGDGKTEAVPVVNGTDIDDVETWTTHVPSGSCAVCATGETCQIHDHWEWTMGGEGDNGGQTTFMPTFNKDKDSLAADINGTYHGTDDTDKVYYDDYVVYTTDENGGVVNEADKEAFDGEILSVNGNAYYDDDADHEENDHDKNIGAFKQEPETHTAKQTATAKVITMAEWLQNPVPGNFWVYDEDGWAYWANPIMPGEATGLLLDGIEMYKNPGEKCYYAINVVGQFATVNDWEYFHGEDETEFDGTDNALTLLETAAKNVATVVVTNVSGETLLTPGSEYQFSANVYVDGASMYAASDFTWSVLNADLTPAKSTITSLDGDIATLTVDPSETAKNLIVVAKAINSDYLGALGMSSVAVDVKDFKIGVAVHGSESEYEIYDGALNPGNAYDFRVTLGGEPVDGVTYEMKSVETGNYYDLGAITDATTFVDGVLTIDEDETTRNGYNSYFKIVEITAKDAEGEVITTRRFLINAANVRMERIVFVDEDGNSTDGGYYTTLAAGKTYTWYVQIQCASTNQYLNEWLTLEDIGAHVILDGRETYSVVTSDYDYTLDEHVYTPSDAATFSADYSTITTNKVYSGDNLMVRILGPEVTEEYDGETYTYNTFELTQGITIANPITYDGISYVNGDQLEILASTSSNPASYEGMTAKSDFSFSANAEVTAWSLSEEIEGVTLTSNGNSATLNIAYTSPANNLELTATFADGSTTTLEFYVFHALEYTIGGESKTTWDKNDEGEPVLSLVISGLSDMTEVPEWTGVTEDEVELVITGDSDGNYNVVDLEYTEPGTYELYVYYNGASYVGATLTITDNQAS